MRVAVITVSDSVVRGERQDTSGAVVAGWVKAKKYELASTAKCADETLEIVRTLVDACDTVGADLILTTGGTGLAPRDVTPEATLAVAHKVMPGFGEQMRQISLTFVPTAILSRQVAVIRGKALIINLPGQPKSIAETLEGLPKATPPAARGPERDADVGVSSGRRQVAGAGRCADLGRNALHSAGSVSM